MQSSYSCMWSFAWVQFLCHLCRLLPGLVTDEPDDCCLTYQLPQQNDASDSRLPDHLFPATWLLHNTHTSLFPCFTVSLLIAALLAVIWMPRLHWLLFQPLLMDTMSATVWRKLWMLPSHWNIAVKEYFVELETALTSQRKEVVAKHNVTMNVNFFAWLMSDAFSSLTVVV